MLKTLLMWAYKLIEIVIVAGLGYAFYFVSLLFVSPMMAIIIVFIIGYFFGDIMRPLIRQLQDLIFEKLLNKNDKTIN